MDLPPIEATPPEVQVPNLAPNPEDLPPNLVPLPGPDGGSAVPSLPPNTPGQRAGNAKVPAPLPIVGITSGSQRVTTLVSLEVVGDSIFPSSTRRPTVRRPISVRGGIILIVTTAKSGTIDIEADEAVIWLGPTPTKGEPVTTPNGEVWEDDDKRPMEVYLEGNVILRQDENKWAGKAIKGPSAPPGSITISSTDRCLAPNAELDIFRARAAGTVPDQVASNRAVSRHGAIAQRDLCPGRAARDPRRPDGHDWQPVPRPRLPNHEPIDRPDAIFEAGHRPQHR